MSKNTPIKTPTTYSPSHRGVDQWHRERNAPGNAPPNSDAAPGNAKIENNERPEKSKDGR